MGVTSSYCVGIKEILPLLALGSPSAIHVCLSASFAVILALGFLFNIFWTKSLASSDMCFQYFSGYSISHYKLTLRSSLLWFTLKGCLPLRSIYRMTPALNTSACVS